MYAGATTTWKCRPAGTGQACSMQSSLTEFQRNQLSVITGVTPIAMVGHILNTTILTLAVMGSVPLTHLLIWGAYSYGVALVLIFRHLRRRGRIARNFRHAARRAAINAFFLALPWSGMAVMYLGSLAHDEELILVALGVGMAASGTILLSALPLAAITYMSGVLLPSAAKCLVLLHHRGYVLLGVLALSYWFFLLALIRKITREVNDRKQADLTLKDRDLRLQEALAAGKVVAFSWDPNTGFSHRSGNASQVLGFVPQAGDRRRGSDFLACLHPDDRARFSAQVKTLSPQKPSYSASFRFIRPDGREVLLEETGRAEFDENGRYLRLRGLTRDITERMRAEIRQLLLVRELDHRVKNVLATVAMVAQRTRERSHSMDQFLQVFDGRIHAMANAQALLSRSHWQGVSLEDLINNSLAPFRVDAPSVKVEGPAVLLSADAVQPIAIALHELATNASKYGALTMAEGSISVVWHWAEGAKPDLLLDWIETGGPPVTAPAEVGYGTGAIRNLIPYELEGSVDLAYDVDGVRCRIRVPSKWFSPAEVPIEPVVSEPDLRSSHAAELPATPSQ
jgi:PAS domain S-box-containing protein